MAFEPFPEWRWDLPEFLNSGVAWTDAQLGTSALEGVALVVVVDAHGTCSST